MGFPPLIPVIALGLKPLFLLAGNDGDSSVTVQSSQEPVTLQEGGWGQQLHHPNQPKPRVQQQKGARFQPENHEEHLSLLPDTLLQFFSPSMDWQTRTYLRLGNHGGLPITQRRKRQTQLCFSITLEKQEVKVNKNRRLSHPDFTSQLQLPRRPLVFLFIITMTLCSKSCILFFCIKDTKRLKPSSVQSFHPTAKAHAVVQKASSGSNRSPEENKQSNACCGQEPAEQSEFLCVIQSSCAYLEPFLSLQIPPVVDSV